MSEQTAEELYAQLNGTVEALVLAFGALVATHSEKEKAMAVITALGNKHAADSVGDSTEIRSYKLGIRKAIATLVKSVETAQLAAGILDIKNQTGSH